MNKATRAIYFVCTAILSNILAWVAILHIESNGASLYGFLVFMVAILIVWIGDNLIRRRNGLEFSKLEIGLCLISTLMVISVLDASEDLLWMVLMFGSLAYSQFPLKIMDRRFK